MPPADLSEAQARGARVALLVPLGLWIAIYPARLFIGHSRFGTNAFDLSIFDYALWSTLHGRIYHVPFLGHSLASHHFMPTLATLLPAYALWPSPKLLILVQAIAFAGAAILLWLLARRRLPPVLLAGVIVAFLFGRRSHSAVSSVFYVESLEPLLVFAVLHAWQSRRWLRYVAAVILALGCKEDMPLYLGVFGALLYATGDRRVGGWTCVASIGWLVLSAGVIVPFTRATEGLPSVNAFWQGRVSDTPAAVTASGVASRVLSARTVSRLAVLVASTGFLAVFSPWWLAVMLPGTLLNFAARPDSVQAGLTGHYLWPVLPWLFWAAVQGGRRLSAWSPRVAQLLGLALIVATIGDSPLWLSSSRGFSVPAPVAAEMKVALELVPADARVLAQPNVIPHLAHRQTLEAIGRNRPTMQPDWVILTSNGDLWPLDDQRVSQLVACYSSSPEFVRVTNPEAPLSIFRRRGSDRQVACPWLDRMTGSATSPSSPSRASAPAPFRGSSVRW